MVWFIGQDIAIIIVLAERKLAYLINPFKLAMTRSFLKIELKPAI